MPGDAASVLREAFHTTLTSIDLAARTRNALGHSPSARVCAVAIGKSAAPMLAGAVRTWLPVMREAIIARPARSLAPDPSTLAALQTQGTVVREFVSGHPLPNQVSVEAGTAILERASLLGRSDIFLVLLSGGASAAACAPAAGVTVEGLRTRYAELLNAGLPIREINAARGSLDRLKLGGLARETGAGRVVTIIASDVIGTDDEVVGVVGSAPTATTESRAAHTTQLIATPRTARATMMQALVERGYVARELPDIVDDVATAADRCTKTALALSPGEAFVCVGEPTVRLPANAARGGRAGRTALAVARGLAGHNEIGFIAASTDGVDGESGHAGAVVTGASAPLATTLGVSIEDALARFDDAPAHEALRTSVTVGPTGINLLDLFAAVRID